MTEVDISPEMLEMQNQAPVMNPDPVIISESVIQPKNNLTIFFVISALILITVGIGGFLLLKNQGQKQPEAEDTTPKKVIGLSLTSLRIERWQFDRDNMRAEAEKRGMLLNVMDANDDANTQVLQAKNLVLQGVDVLIVVANDAKKAGEIVDFAHGHDVKVIAYDRLILDSDLDYYVSFDSVEVGRLQAEGVVAAAGDKKNYVYMGGSKSDHNAILLKEGTMKVLQPLIDSGKITLNMDEFILDWKQEVAYQKMSEFLQGGGKVDAVIAANDGNATGVIQALAEFDLDGSVAVSGQDAELSACKRLVAGTQTITVYKPLKSLAIEAIDLAEKIIQNKAIKVNSTINNGQVDVPAFFTQSVPVTKENIMETVVKDGFHSQSEIYE